MATHTRILTWEIPWTEEPGGLQSLGSQRVGYNLVAKQQEVVFNCLATFFFFPFQKKQIGFINWFKNEAASHLASRMVFRGVTQEDGIYRQKTVWVKKAVSKRKEKIASGQLIFFWGDREQQEFCFTRIRKCQWFKIPLLGEVETAVRLGIKSRWGLPRMTPF